MARSQARIHTSVWRDQDFTDLSPAVQGVYWMLLSQPDMSAAGVTSYNPMRWRNIMGGADISGLLEELVGRGFVDADELTGEVWVRSFARYDGIINSPKTRGAMWSAWHNILSDRIRARFLDELEDVEVTVEGEDVPILEEAVDEGWVTPSDLEQARSYTPPDTPSDTPSSSDAHPPDTPSDRAWDTPSDRGFSPARADSDGDSTSDNDSTSVQKPSQAQASGGEPPNRRAEIFAAICEVCGIDWRDGITSDQRGRVNAAAKQLDVDVGTDPTEIRRRADNYRLLYPDVPLTPQGLTGNWGQLDDPPQDNASHPQPENLDDVDSDLEATRSEAASRWEALTGEPAS